MYKLKNNSSAKKRFKFLSHGRITMHRAGLRHKLESKSNSRLRRLSSSQIVAGTDVKSIKNLTPYFNKKI